MMAVADGLLQDAGDTMVRACLLAASTKESGMWLNVCSISSLGLHMDDQTIHVAVGFRLGGPLCNPTLVTIVEQRSIAWHSAAAGVKDVIIDMRL